MNPDDYPGFSYALDKTETGPAKEPRRAAIRLTSHSLNCSLVFLVYARDPISPLVSSAKGSLFVGLDQFPCIENPPFPAVVYLLHCHTVEEDVTKFVPLVQFPDPELQTFKDWFMAAYDHNGDDNWHGITSNELRKSYVKAMDLQFPVGYWFGLVEPPNEDDEHVKELIELWTRDRDAPSS